MKFNQPYSKTLCSYNSNSSSYQLLIYNIKPQDMSTVSVNIFQSYYFFKSTPAMDWTASTENS